MNTRHTVRALMIGSLLALPGTALAMGSLCDIQDRSMHGAAIGSSAAGTSRTSLRAGDRKTPADSKLAAHFIAAKSFIDEGKPEKALRRLDRAVDLRSLKPDEVYTEAMLRARALSEQGKALEMARAYERAISTGEAPPAAVEYLQQTLAVTYYLEGDLVRSLDWVARYRADGGQSLATLELAPKALFLQGDYPAAQQSARQLITDIRKSDGVPSKSLLQVWSYALARTGGTRAHDVAVRALAHYYPEAETAKTLVTAAR